VARFSVTGLFDQTVACDATLCPGDWVNDVARQIVQVTARDQYGNRVKGYKGTVVFDGSATTVSESKLTNGVGWFAVKPSGLELNQFNHCKSGVPADQDYKALTVTDKSRPTIRGCQVIFYDLYFVLDLDLPVFRNITPDGCSSGCVEDPTETIVIDTEAQPLQVLEVDTIELPKTVTGTVTIVGETDGGKGFTQDITITNPTVESSDLPEVVTDKCTGCSTTGTSIAIDLTGYVFDPGNAAPLDVDPEMPELQIGTVQPVFPGINFSGFVPVTATSGTAAAPTCYKDHPSALVRVHDQVTSC
jgi:hypothetical protein